MVAARFRPTPTASFTNDIYSSDESNSDHLSVLLLEVLCKHVCSKMLH
jgi:hypothetical protein